MIDGIVAIGRNEGERLRLCLDSLSGRAVRLIYVDSGSTDGSVALARAAGAQVVQLDSSAPYTAARARNAGFNALMERMPRADLVQFIDGDCELDAGWLALGARVLRTQPEVSVVCGRRRERFPAASLYNRLCDVEWDTPLGLARACGGDALMRTSAFREVGGFDPGMIAGEEPDLCLRLGRRGSHVMRIDAEMTRHDAAMTRASQWWQRAVRTGHTTAELLAKHGATPEHRRLRRACSALTWAVVLPAVWLTLLGSSLSASNVSWMSLVLLALPLLYLHPLLRAYGGCRRRGLHPRHARAYALSCLLAKWPETAGMALYIARRSARRRPRWIEYKDGPRGGAVREPAP